MKKNLYIMTLAAAISLVGCKDDQVENVDVHRAMQIDVSVCDALTRSDADVTMTDLQKDGSLIHFICQYKDDDGTTIIKKGKITYSPSGFVLTDNNGGTIYWPGNSSTEVSVAAVYGSGLNGFAPTEFGEVLISSYNSSTDYIAAKASLTENQTTKGIIPLAFNHIMSSVTVALTGENANETYRVNNVSLSRSDLYSSSLFYNVMNGTWSNDPDYADPGNPDPTLDYNFQIGSEPDDYIEIVGTDSKSIVEPGSSGPLRLLVVPGTYKLNATYTSAPTPEPVIVPNFPMPKTKTSTVRLEAGKLNNLNVKLPPLPVE